MAERFALGDRVRINHAPGPRHDRVWRVTGFRLTEFRRWAGYRMVAIVTEVGTGHDEVPSYALEHADDAITRLGRLARPSGLRS